MIKVIKSKNEIISKIINFENIKNGIEFFSEDNDILQLGAMSRPKDYKIEPHIHNNIPRSIIGTNEVMYVQKGKIRVNFFDNQKKFICSEIIKKGDWIILKSGGHGFDMIEDSILIEVKNGPYAGNGDKVRF